MTSITSIRKLEDIALREPAMIQGLPGLGYVGKAAVDYFVEKLKPHKFAELHSGYLIFPDGNLGINISPDGTYSLPKYEFYGFNDSEPNVIFLTGDAQPSVLGQYEVANVVLDFAEQYSCRMVLSMGGYGTRSREDVGAVYSIVGDSTLKDDLQKLGARVAKAGVVTGAAGVVLGLAGQRGWRTVGLLGATTGVYPDLEASRAVIQMVAGLLKIPVDFKDLDSEISEMKKKMDKLRRFEVEESTEEQGESQKKEEGKERYIT